MIDVVPLAAARDAQRFGEKASALAMLCAVPGVRVPPGFAVSAAVFRRFIEGALDASQWPERLLAGPESERREDKLLGIRATLASAKLPQQATEEALAAWRALGSPRVAVRSSALHEDTARAAGAGIFTTVLGVDDAPAFERAMRAVYERLFDERVLSYLARLARREAPSVALLVQRIVPATSAGVLFTEDPIRRGAGVMRVEASLGLGSAVVDGTISPDVFSLSRSNGAVLSQQIVEKRSMVRIASSGRVERAAIDPPSRAPALDHEQLLELASGARAVERALGGPRDIEFAFEERTLWVLQARPIVVRHELDGERARWVWSNVNVGEALPGVATPLTWSIAAAFSDLGFRRAFAALGCTVPDGVELVGRFDGRIYLNLTHFLRIAAQVPALDPKLMLEFGGGGGLEEVAAQVEPGSWSRFALRAPVIAARMLRENASLDERLAAYERDSTEFRRRFESLSLGALTRAELAIELERVEALLDRTGTLMLTCASGALASVVLVRALLRSTAGADSARLERLLLRGDAEMESARPGIALLRIAASMREDPAALAVICGEDPARLRVEALPDGPTRRGLEAFLLAYGARAAREAELSTPRWSEDPSLLFATLRAQAARGAATLARLEETSRERARAERAWLDALPAPVRLVARHALARARRFFRLREQMRARVTEVLGYFRSIALEASRRMLRMDPAIGEDAAFFLTVDELRELLRGGIADARAIVDVRRAEHLRDRARPDPPSSFQGAPPASAAPSELLDPSCLRGIAASPGRVHGPVRILTDPREGARLLPGEILVAPAADVGWTPLFLVAAGVVTELGGALSHASLVAREYGVPAVVNVIGATTWLKDGDLVEVDGDTGEVRRGAGSFPRREVVCS